MDLTLPGHANAMNPFEPLEDPTQGRPLRRLVDLVWYRLVLPRSLLTQSPLRHGIDQLGQRHHHQQPLNTTRFFQKQRRDKEQRVFEQPEAALGLGLALVGLNHLRIAQLARLNIGPEHKAGVVLRAVLNRLLIGPNLDLNLPVNRRHRGGAPRPAWASVVGVFDEVEGLYLVIWPWFRTSGQRRLSGLRRLKALGLYVKELLGNHRGFALTSGFDLGLGSLQRRLRRHD